MGTTESLKKMFSFEIDCSLLCLLFVGSRERCPLLEGHSAFHISGDRVQGVGGGWRLYHCLLLWLPGGGFVMLMLDGRGGAFCHNLNEIVL